PASAYTGDAPTRRQLGLGTVERRDPRRGQVRRVARPEQPPDAGEQPSVMLLPAHPGAGPERAEEPLVVGVAGRDALVCAAEEDRAVLVGEHRGVLGRQLERAVLRPVGDIAAGRLVAQPFADIPWRGPGLAGQRLCRDGAGAGHRPIQSELVTEVHQQPGDRRPHVTDRLADEPLQPRLIDFGHLTLLLIVGWPPRGEPPPRGAPVGESLHRPAVAAHPWRPRNRRIRDRYGCPPT